MKKRKATVAHSAKLRLEAEAVRMLSSSSLEEIAAAMPMCGPTTCEMGTVSRQSSNRCFV